MRAGVDTFDRPIGEYLCETCGTVFVALVVSLDARVLFRDVVVDTDRDMGERRPVNIGTALRRGERRPVNIGTALRRGERQPEIEVEIGEERSRIEVCTECGNLVRTDNGEREAHERAHRED
jgi:hypothetical protein